MNLAFACPFYGPTFPLVGDSFRANIINAVEAGHKWIDDYSVSGTQHRQACEAMAYKAAHDKRGVDAVFWSEHDVVLNPMAVVQLCETLAAVPEADVVTGVAFRRGEPYNPMVSRLGEMTPEMYEHMKTSPDYHARRATKLLTFDEMKDKLLLSIDTLDTTAGPFQADTSSMCCLLFRREVFEKVWEIPDLFAVDTLGLFSIDNAFFLRLKDRGFKLFCDPRAMVAHLGDPELITWDTWQKHHNKMMKKEDIKNQEKMRAEDKEARIYGELTRLADKHGTDKGSTDHRPDSGWSGWIHNYCDFYQSMLEPIRLEARDILEIGVWKGASLKMWRDYFPNATVHGLDNWSQIEDIPKDLGERIVIHQGDQANREDLSRTTIEVLNHDPFSERPGIDLIIDDGGHRMDEQQISLGFLFRYVRPGGFYILEDLHTSFMPAFGVEEDRSNATIKVLEALAEGKPAESKYMTADELAYLNENVESCIIYGRKSLTSILRKRKA